MKFCFLGGVGYNSAECRMQSAELWKFFAEAKNNLKNYFIFSSFELQIATKIEIISLISDSKLEYSLSLK